MDENENAKIFYEAFSKKDNSYKYLLKFVDLAEEFNDKKSTYDIIKEYLHLSGNCEESLPFVKELGNADSQNDLKNISFLPMLNVILIAEGQEEILMATNFIRKVLWHTKMFNNCEWEIDVWLDAIKNTKSQHLSVIFQLFSNSLRLSLVQPNLTSFESFSITETGNSTEEKVDALEILKGILNEESDDHQDILEVQPLECILRKQHFSNLVPAILQEFASLVQQNKKVCQPFVEYALLLILHRQFSTNAFFELVKKYQDSLESTTFSYFKMFHALKMNDQDLDEINLSDCVKVTPFLQKALKVSMKCDEVGVEILKVLSLLCAKSKKTNLPTQNLYDLVTGHSNFFNIILTNVKSDGSLKEGVVDLLTVLAKLDASVCKEQHVGLFLGAYQGTMSRVDQKLLYLIKVFSDNGVNMIKYRPFLWGETAITHYSIVNNAEHLNLLKQAKLKDVASLISPEKIEKTILHYPLKMTLLPLPEVVEDINRELACNIYDLRFFLPLLANLLSPGSYVNINCLVESKLLLLIFVSLSSYDADVRALGYYCLSQFYHHLESWRSQEKEIWISLLDCLRNDISSPNRKLPCIITLFLARVTEIFNKPNNPLYAILYKFIMVKPVLDVSHVPEFYKLFNSINLEHRMQRCWLLKLLSDGIRTTADFHICEKRHIFSTMQSLCWCSLSSEQEKVSILRVILSVTKIESSLRTLYKNGLIFWLHAILQNCEITKEMTPIIVEILQNVKAMDKNNVLKLFEKFNVIPR